ncbi:unnamed protein product [Lactuca saligna]|uniref:Ubiquitin-like protease family profile domain-containing protein n=1 Tax=Lactuca saligna TaxID=75948 RepID=A0AA35V078_LACSI|nr:unnamed protein product [Lactuca saligna]
MAHSTDIDSDFVSTTVPTKKVQTNATVRKTGKEIYIDIDSASQDRVKKAKKVQTNATVRKTGKEIYIDIDSASQDRVKKSKNTKKKKILEKKKRHYVSDSSSLQSETSESETSTTESDEYDKVNKKKKRKVKKHFKRHKKLIHNDVKHKKKKHVSDSSTESETESYTHSTDDESDEEIYVKKRTGDRKYVEGVTKIKEAKRKRNSRDNRAAIKKQKTVKEQKTVKDILKELPSINTRSTPGLMTDAHYDEGTNSILIKGKRIKITKEKIHKVFGLPKTGKSLFDLHKVSEDHQVFDGWMKELEYGKANATNYKKIIQKSEQVDMNFKLGFIALFVNTFAESIPMGTNNLVPVRALVEVDDISKIDWCAYLLYCVKNSKGRWHPDNPKCYYIGPMLLLLLIYCDEIECKLQKIERKTPLVTMWIADKLKERQSFEIEAGGFGVGNLIEQSSNLELEKNENQDMRIEEYEEKYENFFNNVSTEKNDMEDIIFHCLSKFPEDNKTKEMIRKFRDIFSTTLFSSREKSETIKERTEVKSDRDEELNKTNISDSDDDKDEGMNTKLVAFLAVKPLQQKFPENEETQEEDQDMNVDDRINLGFENNIGEETIRHPHNPERQIEFEGINVDDKINLALEVNNIDETIEKKNLEDNVESKNLVKGGEIIGGENIREGNIVEKVVGDNIGESSIVTPKHNPKETGDNSEGNDEDGELEGNEEHILDEKGKKGQNVNERGKRKVTNPDIFRSPFVNRVIDLSEKVSTEQEIMAQIMFRCVADKDPMEMLFETESGDIMDRVHFEGMRPNHKIHPFVIDCWAAVLNFEEENLRNKKSPPRVFFNTQIMTEKLLDSSIPFVERSRLFDEAVNNYLYDIKRKVDFNSINLVFFPIHNRGHFYCILFNLTNPEHIIIDNIRYTKKVEDVYGEIPKLVQMYFSKFLTTIGGIRHMEKYMGEKEEKWDVELGESVRTSKKIAKLRTFYVSKLANHQINKQRKLNVTEALEFSKLDKKTRCMLVKEGSEARDNLEMKKV